jgi:mono/diheme cytochrome c family protein
MDAGPLGIVYSSNLTSGRGGIGSTYNDQDWARAIRHGLRPDRTSLLVMPSEAYAHFSDQDLSAVISWLKQVPAVDREHGESKLRIVGRTLLAANKLPFLTAENVTGAAERASVEPGVTVEYGKYLATTGGCNGCHGPDLAGGLEIGPPGSPPSSNLTPAGIGSWSESDFFRALREGKRPDGTDIDPVMPWRFSGRMTDDELRAIWLYLQSVPAKETPAVSN